MFGHESHYDPERSLTTLRSVRLFERALRKCDDPELVREGKRIAERAKTRIQLREAMMADTYHCASAEAYVH